MYNKHIIVPDGSVKRTKGGYVSYTHEKHVRETISLLYYISHAFDGSYKLHYVRTLHAADTQIPPDTLHRYLYVLNIYETIT